MLTRMLLRLHLDKQTGAGRLAPAGQALASRDVECISMLIAQPTRTSGGTTSMLKSNSH